MKTVMIFGTFDLLHKGHIDFFKQARKYGDYLIIAVARDKTVKKIKSRKPHYDEKQRLDAVKPYADKAVLGYLEDKYKNIEKYKPDVICLGYDQKDFTEKLEKELKKRDIKSKIIRLNPYKPDIYKSSKLKKEINS